MADEEQEKIGGQDPAPPISPTYIPIGWGFFPGMSGITM